MKRRMKNLSALVLAIIMVLSLMMPATYSFAEGGQVKVTVLGTTDIHGNIYDWSYEDGKAIDAVGLTKVHTIVKQVRAENPNTLLIDNGDNVQGTVLTDDLYNSNLSEPNPMMDVMNLMGYDSMTLGNHEFNFGLDLIKKMEKEAKFPILSANTYNKADGTNFVKPYVVKEVAGIKVGILGLTTPNIPRWDGPKVTTLEFKHMAEEAEKYVKILKEQEKVELVVVAAHADLNGEYDVNKGDAAGEIINKVKGIDALLKGHDHKNESGELNGVLYGGAKDKGAQVVRFDFTLQNQGGTWNVADKKVQLIETKGVEPAKEVVEQGKMYHEKALTFLKDVLATAEGNFHPDPELPGIPEAQLIDTAVIDLINKVQLKYTGADVSAAALFKNDSNIKEGPVTYSSIFDIYKYPNTLVAVEVTGKELKQYMEWSASYYNTYKPGDVTVSFNPEIRGYNYDMFAGVDYEIDISKPAGERIVNVMFKGEPLKDEQILKLAVNNYRYGSTLQTNKYISKEKYFDSDPKSIRSFIADYIKEQGTITPEVDNNWKIVGADLNHPLKDQIYALVKAGAIKIPTSEDGRTPNVKALNADELVAENQIPFMSIVHTNDTHSRLETSSSDGMGFDKIASYIKELKKSNIKTLVIDAGDAFHGQTIASLVKGESVAKVMNQVGYDAMTPGNHDFNYGQERLLELDQITNFPILAANIKKDGKDLLTPYTIKEVGGKKVGIFGLATPETTYKTHPNNVVGLIFEDPIKAAEKMVVELKDKVDIIVAISHLGLNEDSEFTSKMVAEKVKDIDLIIDGHSHTVLQDGLVVGDTLIAQTGEYDKNLGVVHFYAKDGKITEKKAVLIDKAAAAQMQADTEVKNLIAAIKAGNEQITSVVVGKTMTELNGVRGNVRTGETNLGNLITDAMIDATKADIAITNGGGIRASINEGEITKGEVITVLPFGNYVVVKEIKGADILAALEHGVDAYPAEAGHFAHVAGLTYKFNPKQPVGQRISEVMVGKAKLDPNKTYKLATNDFMAAGGDKYDMFKDEAILGEYPALDEILASYIAAKGTVDAKVEGRIVATDKVVVPTEKTPASVAKSAVAAMKEYVVKAGDLLWKIAKEFGVAYEKLAEINNIKNPNLIVPGQKLVIPQN
ncbi:MAG: multifunctional 2,3-cyclic-nucleotide 2-phosphodiesterase/5-nucleotidase/3-nucleotidase [Anaerosolibacter sp.]|uniref:5'-nucleotidase C-terminal domain-containing protein n=1 Tax=Anaerosolibacter sp. TaxID=1872527 RepID=UPI002620FE64|nr:5'-nucleotidase C-terminal domain-containing protein [Anaerosolibacter sp.]MDF2547515.1 multifunctional 2,3-cyclic-nucleotide 2-phosphodiesterase/5-nucleotidase/3-nucleotidase [Anaerosolibacter sp.]